MGVGKKLKRLQEAVKELLTRTEQVQSGMDSAAGALTGRIEALEKQQSHFELSMGDMVDSWEEWQETLKDDHARVEELLTRDKTGGQDRERETALLSLAIALEDQMFALRHAAEEAGDSAWLSQLEMQSRQLTGVREACGLQVVEETGVPFSFDIYEAVETVPTLDRRLDMHIAGLYAPGYSYDGKVIRKAEAAVWRCQDGGQGM